MRLSCYLVLLSNDRMNKTATPLWPDIIWTNAEILLIIWHLGTNLNEILAKIHAFSLKKINKKNINQKMVAILCLP